MAQSAGFSDLALRLAQDTFAELHATGATRLLTLSAGDYYTFTQMVEERLGLTRPVDLLFRELPTYLADQLAAGEITFSSNGILSP